MKRNALKNIIAGLTVVGALGAFASGAVAQTTQIGPAISTTTTISQSMAGNFVPHPIITGPAIWQIGRNPGTASVPSFTVPEVMPPQRHFQFSQPFGVQPFQQSYYPTTTVIIIDGDNGPYVVSGDMGYFPSVFSGFDGQPGFIYTPSVFITFDPNGNMVFQDIGSYYPYAFDPFQPTVVPNLDQGASLSPDVSQALNNFATGWVDDNALLLTSYIPQNGSVSLAAGSQYQYSLNSSAYLKLASASLKSLTTSDFHYTGVRVSSNGDALASAVQTYRTSDGTLRHSNLQIALKKDSSTQSGYRLAGFGIVH